MDLETKGSSDLAQSADPVDLEQLVDMFQRFVAEHHRLKHGALSVECTFCGWNPYLKVTGRWELHIPPRVWWRKGNPTGVPSLNVLKAKDGIKTLRWKYRELREKFEKDISLLLYNQPTEAYDCHVRKTVRRVVITRHMGKGEKEYDRDNFIGGCKSVVDVLRRTGLIVDDSRKWLISHYAQKRDRNNPGLNIIVEEVE